MEVASPAGWMVMHSSGRFFKKVEESFMERLNYEVLKKSGYDGYVLKDAPEKVLQFGEGNFLRAFVDYWFDLANEKAGRRAFIPCICAAVKTARRWMQSA